MLSLGLDLSTQQLKAVALDAALRVHSTHSVTLDECATPHTHTHTVNGVRVDPATGEVVTPVAVFVNALQTLLDRMRASGFPFHLVHSVAGSAQQHGTVYYTGEFDSLLASIGQDDNDIYDDTTPWSQRVAAAFAFDTATNWQDTSTSAEVAAFDAALGSAQALAEATGSRAHYRFSGPQMRRRARVYPNEWARTRRVTLISTLLHSLLVGKLCPIEPGDACGMNLYDIQSNDWIDPLLALVLGSNSVVDNVDIQAQNRAALQMRGLLQNPESVTLPIASYLVKKYGFNDNCLVCPITGDNLATVMALPLLQNDVLISMGTSTTVLLLTDKYVPSKDYHLFLSPVTNSYMAMLCYSNGALAREAIAIALDESTNTKAKETTKATPWRTFTDLLAQPTPPNTVAVFFPHREIIPDVPPQTRWWDGSTELPPPPPLHLAPRLIVESQALANRVHMAPLLEHGRPNRVFFAGGSTRNKPLVQLYTQVLAPETAAFIASVPDLCALGGALRAHWELVRNHGNPSYNHWLAQHFDPSTLQQLPVERDHYSHKAQLYFNAQSFFHK